MTFKKLQSIIEEKFGTTRLADIAKEFDVTPQVVSNWKSRDQVPYKYVKILREKIDRIGNTNRLNIDNSLPYSAFPESVHSIGGASLENDDGVSIEKLFENLYKIISNNFKLFLTIPSVIVLFTIIHVQYFVEPVYLSHLKFLPLGNNEAGMSSKVQGIASSFGFDIGGNVKSASLSSANMYPEIIQSRTLARTLLRKKFYSKKYDKSLTLSSIMNNGGSINDKDSVQAISQLITSLSRNISVSKGRGVKLLTLSVKSSEPQLSADIALGVIDVVNEIQKKFQSKSISEKRIFIEERTEEVSIGLKKAEENLKLFRESNRSVMSSPALMLEQARLLREVEVQTQIYITLKSQYELNKIEEVGKGNSVEILDPPEIPFLKSSPNKRFRVLVASFLSLFLSLFVIFTKDHFNNTTTYFGKKKIFDL